MDQTAQRPEGLAAYIAVTAAYWAFMLTDGALRMLVLLHFHTLGFTPIQLAYLFLLYEFMGMVTNLAAGWIAARFGLTFTLYVGLGIQVAALLALSLLDPGWAIGLSVLFVMAVQGASGVAKDLSKMSAKSAVKILAPSGDGALFKWVAVLTGSKNAVKGLGFLLGAALLAGFGFTTSVLGMAAILAVIGYSLNDTIVVSDRIRENFKKLRLDTSVEIINASLNQTLGRTVVTSLTTFLVLLALLIFGGELIRGFSIALMIGVFIGNYSSMFVASNVLLLMDISKEDFIEVKPEDIDGMP